MESQNSAYTRAIQMMTVFESRYWQTALHDPNSPIYQATRLLQHHVLKALSGSPDHDAILNPIGANTVSPIEGIVLTAPGTQFVRLREFLEAKNLLN